MEESSRASSAEAALQHFRQRTGAEATHLVYSPGRVNFIGEYTDFNGGFVLPLAIDMGIYIAARVRGDDLVRLSAVQPGYEAVEFKVTATERDPVQPWSNYVRGVVAGLAAAGLKLPGFDAVIHADLPAGGGLSSSAALEVAAATLGEALRGFTLDPLQKALLCQKAEHEFAGTPCGIMDQFSVIFGKSGHLLLLDCASLEYTPVPLSGSGVSLLVINTMVRHELSGGEYRRRREDCMEAARLLGVRDLRGATPEMVEEAGTRLPDRLRRRARHVTAENARTLAAAEVIRQGAWEEAGRLMYASHVSLREDMEVSCAELDAVVDAARACGTGGGVYGCRMTGGGFGGCCVALVERGREAEISAAIHSGYQKATGIEPLIFITQPADGARILLKP